MRCGTHRDGLGDLPIHPRPDRVVDDSANFRDHQGFGAGGEAAGGVRHVWHRAQPCRNRRPIIGWRLGELECFSLVLAAGVFLQRAHCGRSVCAGLFVYSRVARIGAAGH